jgi:hypothetical protein
MYKGALYAEQEQIEHQITGTHLLRQASLEQENNRSRASL